MKKIPTDLDVIIIGSGMGGLTTAGLLSRTGKKVLVLEQHTIAGGSTHTYEDFGYEFDTGIHYIGNIKKREKILNLITKNKIKWQQLGKEQNYVYDNLIIDDDKYPIRAGYENLINDLSKWFPKEKGAITKYMELCKTVSKIDLHFMIKIIKPRCLANIINYFHNKTFYEYSQISVKKMLDRYFTNPRLKAIIGGMSIDGGPPPKKQSFYIHASIVNHFAEGAYYPVGGCSIFANEISKQLFERGSRVLVNAPVNNIIISNGKACGVRVKNKYNIYAKTIVSDIGIRNTYKKLIDQNLEESKYFDNVLNNISSNISYNFIFIGMKKNGEELGLKTNNIYMWPETSFDDSVDKYENDPFNENSKPPIFIASNSMKDPIWKKRFPNKSVISAISWSNTNMFNTNGIPRKRKDPKYTKNKEIVENVLLEAIFKHYPKVKNNIHCKSTSTSESVKYYLGSYNGEVYGLDGTTKRFDYSKIRPKTNIENLYLTGQDIVMVGFSAVVISGVLTASEILGYGTIPDIVTGRNIIDDIGRL